MSRVGEEKAKGGREGGVGGGGVRVEISEEEMRIQKGGHHSDSHLFSFSPSHTCRRAPTPALHLRRAVLIFQWQRGKRSCSVIE